MIRSTEEKTMRKATATRVFRGDEERMIAMAVCGVLILGSIREI